MDKISQNNKLFNAVFLNNQDEIKTLLKKGADINTQNSYGSTPLMHAIKNLEDLEDLDTIKLILDNNPDLDIKNKNKKTALKIAQERLMEISEKTDDQSNNISETLYAVITLIKNTAI